MENIPSDKRGQPVFTVLGDNGERAIFTYDQALAKFYHADLYNIEFPKGFDVNHAADLEPKKRKAYVQQTVKPEKIIEFFISNTGFCSCSRIHWKQERPWKNLYRQSDWSNSFYG